MPVTAGAAPLVQQQPTDSEAARGDTARGGQPSSYRDMVEMIRRKRMEAGDAAAAAGSSSDEEEDNGGAHRQEGNGDGFAAGGLDAIAGLVAAAEAQ